MSVRSRWLGRLSTRLGLLATAKAKGSAALVRKRTKQVAEARAVLARHPAGSRRGATLTEARKWIGKTESPYGSNKAPWGLMAWQSALGSWLVGQAWCGTFVYHCLTVGGKVEGLTYRCAAVRFIEEDARAGRNGWKKTVPIKDALPGDAVTFFGGAHVGIVEVNHYAQGYLTTIEGNTSAGNSGSQSNGGGCFRRTRPLSAVHVVCRPRYV